MKRRKKEFQKQRKLTIGEAAVARLRPQERRTNKKVETEKKEKKKKGRELKEKKG